MEADPESIVKRDATSPVFAQIAEESQKILLLLLVEVGQTLWE